MGSNKSAFQALVGLNEGERAAIGTQALAVEQSIDRALGRIRQQFQAETALLDLVSRAELDDLLDRERRHWRDLFLGDGARTVDSAKALTQAQQATGLGVEWTIATQTVLIDELMAGLGRLGPEGAPLTRTAGKLAMLDLIERAEAFTSQREELTIYQQLVAMSEHLGSEIGAPIEGVITSAQEVERIADRMRGAMTKTREVTDAIVKTAQGSGHSVEAVAAATEELSASTQEIGARVHRSAVVADNAVKEASDANVTMGKLAEASRKIEDVVRLINQVAGQTRLLALNATIEAARAGEAGRGFAVVASEVKSLADQTSKSTDEIRAQVTAIQAATKAAIEALGRVTGTITEISTIAQEVSGAVQQQVQATHEISHNAQVAAHATVKVAEDLDHVNDSTQDTLDLAVRVRDNSVRSSHLLVDLRKRLTVLLHSSEAGDRRAAQRYSVDLPARLDLSGRPITGNIGDISETGLFFMVANDEIRQASKGRIVIDGLGELPVRVVAKSDKGSHLAFERLPTSLKTALQGFLRRLHDAERPFIDRIISTAAAISNTFEQALTKGEVALDDLFDESYMPIAGTDPLQYRTRFLDFTDRVLPPFQEPVLAADQRVAFCAAVDRNGYLPTHNRKYSQPQGKDPVWNAANARNRRIFDDPAGLADARNTAEYLLQTYPRDMGGGKIIRMKSISAPIWVRKKHWGGLRFAMSIN